MKHYTDPISKSLYALSKKYEMQTMFDMYALYIEIQNTYKELVKKYPDINIKTFDLPLDDGSFLRFDFSDPSNILLWDNNKMGEKNLITKKCKTIKELQDIMNVYVSAMHLRNVHLGEEPTLQFMNSLNDAQVGDILTYNTGASFTVKSRNGLALELLPAYQDLHDISLQNFMSQETKIFVAGNPDDMRSLYYMAKDLRTETCELRLSSMQSTKIALENQLLPLKTFETKKFIIGDEYFVGQKTFHGFRFFDKNGKDISEDTVVRFYAWAKNSPAVIDVSSNNKQLTLLDEYEKLAALEKLQNIFANQKVEAVATQLDQLLLENQMFEFSIHGLSQKDGNFVAEKYVFAKEDTLKIFKVTDDEITSVSLNEFVTFYNMKYHEHYQCLHQISMDTVSQSMTQHDDFYKTKTKVQEIQEQLLKQVPLYLQTEEEDGMDQLIESFLELKPSYPIGRSKNDFEERNK